MSAIGRLLPVGFGVLALGGALDLLVHAAPGMWMQQAAAEQGAHLVTFAGMVLCLVGLPSRRRPRGD